MKKRFFIIILLIVTLFNLYTTLSFADDTVPDSDFQIYSAGSVSKRYESSIISS